MRTLHRIGHRLNHIVVDDILIAQGVDLEFETFTVSDGLIGQRSGIIDGGFVVTGQSVAGIHQSRIEHT